MGKAEISAMVAIQRLRQETDARITDVICAELCVEPDAVVDSASIREDLRADSIECVVLVMALEDAFDIGIEDEDAAKFHTVGDVRRYIHTRVGGHAVTR